jgi:hypothetical protein
VARGVCYRLVSEPQVETSGRYVSGILVRVSWSISNSHHEIENLKRNNVAEDTQEMKCHISYVRVQRIMTIPFEFGSDHHCRIMRYPGLLDQSIGENGSYDKKEQRLRS